GRACRRRRVATISGNAWSTRSPAVALAIVALCHTGGELVQPSEVRRAPESPSTDRRALHTPQLRGSAEPGSSTMEEDIALDVNGRTCRVHVDPSTPLLYVLRNDLDLPGAKFGCGVEQCGACKALIDGEALPTCRAPVASFRGRTIVTIEGNGNTETQHP